MAIMYHTIQAMAMPFTVALVMSDSVKGQEMLINIGKQVEKDLRDIENKFSPFISSSLVSIFRSGDKSVFLDSDFQEIYALCISAEQDTNGGFNPYFDGGYNPTGVVKGWAIEKMFNKHLLPLLNQMDIEAVALNGAGDIQMVVAEWSEFTWQVGIERADNSQMLLSQLNLKDGAVATSGYSKKGAHITGVCSAIEQVTIVASSLTQADIWATALLALPEYVAREQIVRHQLSGLYQKADDVIYFQYGGFQND